MAARKLIWAERHDKLFGKSEVATINVLTMDNFPKCDPAHYEVRRSGAYGITATFWAMNRGITLNNDCPTLDFAKGRCQDHYDRLVAENSEEGTIL